MTIEEQIQGKIESLIQSIDKSIPVKWIEIHINAEVSESGGTIYFFFKPENETEFYYSVSIPQDFNVDNRIFRLFYREQYDISEELWQLFVKNGLPIWSSVIISYINRKLIVQFDYSPWIESPYGPNDRMSFFEYKYISYQPKDDKELQKFQEMQEFQNQHNSPPL